DRVKRARVVPHRVVHHRARGLIHVPQRGEPGRGRGLHHRAGRRGGAAVRRHAVGGGDRHAQGVGRIRAAQRVGGGRDAGRRAVGAGRVAAQTEEGEGEGRGAGPPARVGGQGLAHLGAAADGGRRRVHPGGGLVPYPPVVRSGGAAVRRHAVGGGDRHAQGVGRIRAAQRVGGGRDPGRRAVGAG